MANRSPIAPAVAALVLMVASFGLAFAAWAGVWVAYPIVIALGVVTVVLLGVAARRSAAAESMTRAGPEADHRDSLRPPT